MKAYMSKLTKEQAPASSSFPHYRTAVVCLSSTSPKLSIFPFEVTLYSKQVGNTARVLKANSGHKPSYF